MPISYSTLHPLFIFRGKPWNTDCSYPPDRACGTEQEATNVKEPHCSGRVVKERKPFLLLMQHTARKLKMKTRNHCKNLPQSLRNRNRGCVYVAVDTRQWGEGSREVTAMGQA